MTFKAIQFALSSKSESVGIRRLLIASNLTFQRFVSFSFNIEFEAKELHGQGLKAISEALLKRVDINKILEEARVALLGFGQNVLKTMIEQFQLNEAVKSVNFDDI